MNRWIEWFAGNRVAANVLMALIVAGGLITAFTVKVEFFPEFSLDLILVTVEYPGAAPEEVEEAVCARIEEAVQGLEDVKQVTSTARENVGVVSIELQLGADAREVLDDVKNRVDAIDTFPEETEQPVIQEATNQRQVIDVAVYGDVDPIVLRRVADRVRDDISALPGITLVNLANARPYEISIEVSENALRRHGLTFSQVAGAVRRSSLDLPGGSVKTAGGEILLRTVGQAEIGTEFEQLALLTRDDGTKVLLGDVATVIDGFADTDQSTRFDQKPAVLINVFRTGEQNTLDVAAKVKDYVEQAAFWLPEGIDTATFNDTSKILRDRLDLLLRNGLAGFMLVFIVLALFLRFRLAFWVSLGIPISFLGAVWLMPGLDVSVNMISLFAFIVVLGIVVDDAIIVGENVFTQQERTGEGLEGSILGAKEVSKPVVFAVLTTVAAFSPLLSVAGMMGKIMRVIPLIVIPCLLFSLLESLFILPAHLSHKRTKALDERSAGSRAWRRFQSRFGEGLKWVIRTLYSPVLEVALRWRYATLAIGISTLLLTAGLVAGGFVRFVFFPDVPADVVSAALTLPNGTPVKQTAATLRLLEESAERARREIEEETGENVFKHVITAVGSQPFKEAQAMNAGGAGRGLSAGHIGEVVIELTPAEDRATDSDYIADLWRQKTGPIPDVDELTFGAAIFHAGDDVDVQLTGPDIDQLDAAAEELKRRLAEYNGVYDIGDSFQEGKREVELDIKPQAQLVGLTLSDLGRQVRQAFYGEEAQRIQRGRDELKVMVRYPEVERRSLGDLENMRIRTPDGLEVPFSQVATVEFGRGFASIKRVDRRRAVNVTADIDEAMTAPGEVIEDLEARVLPGLLARYNGVSYTFEGSQAEQRDTLGGLLLGLGIALIAIFALLAVPLRSYAQPLLIMAAIPFGLVGAVWGHVILGLNLTILSLFGIVALSGVVVNDSLVMVDFVNRFRERKGSLTDAVRQAGVVRFRPILLTSATTFVGLTPLMLEQSMQARFLIPMAVSLAFGVVFSTFITLMLIPAGYLVLNDLSTLPARIRAWRASRAPSPQDEEEPVRGAAAAGSSGAGMRR